ncbi:HAD family hydrolase [Streptomyces sp. NPDC020192]|uniref:HAD family hydrolase n=1 Tax=Streptomyces sp. NPDC020192 TaxID=3365066 RepID=UPI0037AF76A1
MTVRALAVDFGGTLARPGPSPDGATVSQALKDLENTSVPEGFAAAFEDAARDVRQEDRASDIQSPFAEQLARAAHACAAVIPDPQAATEAVFTAVPDAFVDARSAETLRRLHASGLVCVLSCNTQRPESVRRRTLRAAGIEDCFDALVLSSVLGFRKPHPRFYDTVIERAGCPAEEIVFVGDTPAKDAIGPYEHGMRAVLIASGPRPEGLPAPVGVIGHFTELPAYLEALDD